MKLGSHFATTTSHKTNLKPSGASSIGGLSGQVSEQTLLEILKQKVKLNIIHVRQSEQRSLEGARGSAVIIGGEWVENTTSADRGTNSHLEDIARSVNRLHIGDASHKALNSALHTGIGGKRNNLGVRSVGDTTTSAVKRLAIVRLS